ncbi:telomeric repeat binding factor 1, putative [Plasmodium berghei]|uniref:Telomeric repeat binding factor 1, putative n=2 Tax=Plasmodium berghei TaxID=5821 RepID=A0A509AIX5_PLABA|nr:telomeric repeat binding factor 1, putative [Plasmodium berghei ANKA]CXI34788.1 telomeric repeat binding factor 1, putative [Plasmodium berghei]SCM21431.1 telomeric repeat binding factor 1, putative [Plasmodium berghei]SCN24655.1 telomeric repeat binding factor 1, putative [Plasmodium berghei]SCO59812.1 telomeric repeat binding factor 1, putative [Plasmodium berghei]SCO61086.1 telomeric repeat binding factor 1, putative [Plasmodium berghei]|eukprot:XP_034421229.1 telomeric repeat binding factor 1, putative [Plasmodium berghei ANKA]
MGENSPSMLTEKKETIKGTYIKKKKKEKIYRSYVRWEKREVELLVNGIKKYGLSNWTAILQSYDFPKYRTSTSLKDKYRNFKKVFFI